MFLAAHRPAGSEGKATDLSFFSSAAVRQFFTVFSSWSSHFSEPHWGTWQWMMKRAAIPLAWLTATAEHREYQTLASQLNPLTDATMSFFFPLAWFSHFSISMTFTVNCDFFWHCYLEIAKADSICVQYLRLIQWNDTNISVQTCRMWCWPDSLMYHTDFQAIFTLHKHLQIT